MVTREDVVNFLNRMELDFEEVSDGMWLAYPDEEQGGTPLVISHAPPLLVFRLKVLDVPRDGDKCKELYKRLLVANASELVHAAYGLEEDDVILTDSLQLENLDFNEFQATVDSFQHGHGHADRDAHAVPRLLKAAGLSRSEPTPVRRNARAPGPAVLRRGTRTAKTMGIFSKLSLLIRSNLNDLIARAENPEKMLEQVIIDMREQQTKAKQEVALAIAEERKLKAQVESEAKQAQEWERRAVLALQQGRDDLARQALLRQQEYAAARPEHARDVDAPGRRHRKGEGRPAPAAGQDRGGAAQEEPAGGQAEAGAGAKAHPRDHGRPERHVRVRDVRADGAEDRAHGAAGPGRRRGVARSCPATRWKSSSRRWRAAAAARTSSTGCWR